MSVRSMALTGLFAALMAVSSQFSIQIGPVPHTLQVFFVMLAGIILGARLGFLSIAVWVALGVFGLPVFAQGKAGLAVLAGPTGGFLLGFAVCAFLVGWLTGKTGLSITKVSVVMMIGLIAIYLIGLAGFMVSFQFFLHKPMTVEKAMTLAVLPFLPFDMVKTLIASFLGVKIRRALDRAGLSAHL